MRIETDPKLDFDDVLIRPKRSTLVSRSQVSLGRKYITLHSNIEMEGVPIMAANMDSTGTFDTALALSKSRIYTCIHKHYTQEDWDSFMQTAKQDDPTTVDTLRQYICLSCGTNMDDFSNKTIPLITKYGFNKICIDVANGYSEGLVQFVQKIRQMMPRIVIIAGNVVTGEMCEQLTIAGADIIKVGIGPGSVCTTRKKTGVGYPQLSAVIECADAAHGLGSLVIADGGCTCPGDVAKAFGAGADFVMLGGMLAGHDESGGELETDPVTLNRYKVFYGMSSSVAMEKYAGGVANYRASEGKCVRVDYRGPISKTVQDILGGIRSACTYIGASSIKEMSKRTTFVLVSRQLNQVFS